MGNPSLRYTDIIEQTDIIARLKGFSDFFAAKGGVPGHILLIGEDGVGKSTIAMHALISWKFSRSHSSQP